MEIISKNDIEELSNVHDANCISIYIPAHRSGQAVLQKEDAIRLKNQLKEVKEKLEDEHISVNEIERFLKPVQELVDDNEFWTRQSDGLAIFLSDGFFRYFSIPLNFIAFNYLANDFYLKPLMPMFTGDGRFFILSLKLDEINLLECTRHTIEEVKIDELTPDHLEEVVGHDYEQKSLQFRSQQEGHGEATFHGHGEGSDDRKNEILRFFRAVDEGIMNVLCDEHSPMIIVSLDYLIPIYKEVNTYPHLLEDHIPKNPSDMDPMSLHEKAWNLIQPYFSKERKDKAGLFQQFRDTERTSTDIEEIVPAAIGGKVDSLFLQNDSEIWGLYKPETNKVEIHEEHQAYNVSLLNLVAIKVFLQGGNVYILEKNEMPVDYSHVNALYRY